jgi:hypothetical protein
VGVDVGLDGGGIDEERGDHAEPEQQESDVLAVEGLQREPLAAQQTDHRHGEGGHHQEFAQQRRDQDRRHGRRDEQATGGPHARVQKESGKRRRFGFLRPARLLPRVMLAVAERRIIPILMPEFVLAVHGDHLLADR